MGVEEIRKLAGSLPDNEKGILAGELLAAIAPSEYDVSDAQVAERVADLESGKVKDIGLSELCKRLGK